MNQYDLANALKVRIVAVIPTTTVGIGTIPSENPSTPYAILYPLGTAATYGTIDDPQDTGSWEIQVRCVGETSQQCAWLQDKIRGVVTARTGSGWTHSLDVSGIEPEDRVLEEYGAIVEADTELHYCNDVYSFRRSFT